jgi:hypothetical protein
MIQKIRRASVGRLGHDLGHKLVKQNNPGGRLAMTKHSEMVHIEGGQISPGATALILRFNLDGEHGWAGWVGEAAPRLNAGLLVGGNDELVVSQPLTNPPTLFHTNPGCDRLVQGLRVTGKDPLGGLTISLSLPANPLRVRNWQEP